jgi:hypothetical protein
MGKNHVPHGNRSALVAAMQRLVDGLTLHGDKLGPMVIHGRLVSAQQLIDAINVIIASAGEVGRRKQEWREAVAARRRASRALRLAAELVAALIAD